MIAEIPESITRAELDSSSPIPHFVPPVVILSTTITSDAMEKPETLLTPPASDDDSYDGSDSCIHFKSDYAIQVIRHLPYFDSTCIKYVHYKSKPLDLTAFTLDDFEKHMNYHQDREFWSSEGEQMDPSDVVCIAVGHESFSRELWLNVKDCEIFEDFHAGDLLDAVPVEGFFDNLKEQYQSLKFIPGKRRITVEAENLLEQGVRIKEEDVTGQTEEWGTDLDVQCVRKIYRDHGWPGSFDMETASEAIDKWLEPLGGGEGGRPRGLVWQRVLPTGTKLGGHRFRKWKRGNQ
ncbi:hypothetical protein FPRO06_07156 [Fusarium proliferatum]|nr:hypothetical protein FPRO06_07156 [Fusarium proliferatum]